MSFAMPASASTLVSGNLDTNEPLEINPSADPLTYSSDIYSNNDGRRVFRIQKMPVTKRVARVTVGDLAGSPSCASGVRASLFVRELANGREAAGGTSVRSVADQTLPTTLGRVTWSIPPTTLHQGRAYQFHVSNDVGGNCSAVTVRTWRHNHTTVDSGPAPGCELYFGSYQTYYRIWHVQGRDDWNCPDLVRPWSFNPSMPTGWLSYNTNRYFASYTILANGQRTGSCDPGITGEGRYWATNSDGSRAYICAYPQFPDGTGVEVEDGWYYGRPWIAPGRDGAPRDMYLRLDTIDYAAELREHLPIFRYDSNESFFPMSPGGLSEFYVAGSGEWDSNKLQDALGPFALANSELAQPVDPNTTMQRLTLGFLKSTYPAANPVTRRSNTASETTDDVSARGDYDDGQYDDDAFVQQSKPEYRDRIYGRVAHGGDGALWLQYWHFYYFNPPTHGFGSHEGDWEMVQLRLNGDLNVDRAAYAQHGGGSGCDPDRVEWEGRRPRVYVALNSHASYFHATDMSQDQANGEGLQLYNPEFEEIKEASTSWLGWRGQWGDSDSSPQGPKLQGTKWTDPSTWAASNAGLCFGCPRGVGGRSLWPWAALSRSPAPDVEATTRPRRCPRRTSQPTGRGRP